VVARQSGWALVAGPLRCDGEMSGEARYEGYTAHAAHEAAVTLFLPLLASTFGTGIVYTRVGCRTKD